MLLFDGDDDDDDDSPDSKNAEYDGARQREQCNSAHHYNFHLTTVLRRARRSESTTEKQHSPTHRDSSLHQFILPTFFRLFFPFSVGVS